MINELVSVKEYADMVGISRQMVHKLVLARDYRIKTMRVGNRLFINKKKSNYARK